MRTPDSLDMRWLDRIIASFASALMLMIFLATNATDKIASFMVSMCIVMFISESINPFLLRSTFNGCVWLVGIAKKVKIIIA